MLFSSSTDIYSGIGQVATGIFSDIQGYVIAIIGMVFGFFVITMILSSLYPDKYIDNTNDK